MNESQSDLDMVIKNKNKNEKKKKNPKTTKKTLGSKMFKYRSYTDKKTVLGIIKNAI